MQNSSIQLPLITDIWNYDKSENETEVAQRSIAAIAISYRVSIAELLGPCRKGELVQAKAEAAQEIWENTEMTLAEIGEILGGRTPSTIANLKRIAGGKAVCRAK